MKTMSISCKYTRDDRSARGVSKTLRLNWRTSDFHILWVPNFPGYALHAIHCIMQRADSIKCTCTKECNSMKKLWRLDVCIRWGMKISQMKALPLPRYARVLIWSRPIWIRPVMFEHGEIGCPWVGQPRLNCKSVNWNRSWDFWRGWMNCGGCGRRRRREQWMIAP